MQDLILMLARLLTPAAERTWLDAFAAEMTGMTAVERRNWLAGLLSIIVAAHLRQLRRTGPMLLASLATATTVTILDYRGGTEQLSTALLAGIVGFLAYWFPKRGWQWLGVAWAGMLVLGLTGLYSRMQGSIPLPMGPVVVLIGLGLRRSFDRLQERKKPAGA